ncbi:MAG: T9SS type A sorting domain-containing protein [Candidatus Kapaibacterium sp.]
MHSEQMSAATKSSIDIQAPNGVYFVHIKTTNGQSIMKFIKE